MTTSSRAANSSRRTRSSSATWTCRGATQRPPYQHTQLGGVILVATSLGVLGAAAALIVTVRRPLSAHGAGVAPPLLLVLLVIALGAIGLVMFSRLTIRVDDARLTWWFGPRILRKSVPVADIADATAVRNAWWYGWGIHLTPRGWLYNVSGLDGVEVTLHSGRRFRLGTDESATLARAILDRRTAASPSSTVW